MSTSIDCYPTSGHFPTVEETRARTEELFQELLDRHRIKTRLTIEARSATLGIYTPINLSDRWEPGFGTVFAYLLDGQMDSYSWPECVERDVDDYITSDDLDFSYGPKDLGRWSTAVDLTGEIPDERILQAEKVEHYWWDQQPAAKSAIAGIGYGLTMAAVAEQTGGFLLSWDSAFEDLIGGKTAAEFLAWWGDDRLSLYGADRFRRNT